MHLRRLLLLYDSIPQNYSRLIQEKAPWTLCPKVDEGTLEVAITFVVVSVRVPEQNNLSASGEPPPYWAPHPKEMKVPGNTQTEWDIKNSRDTSPISENTILVKNDDLPVVQSLAAPSRKWKCKAWNAVLGRTGELYLEVFWEWQVLIQAGELSSSAQSLSRDQPSRRPSFH